MSTRFKLEEEDSGCHCCGLYRIVDTQTDEEICQSDSEEWAELILAYLNNIH